MQLIKEVMVGAALQLLDADIIEPVVVSKESKKRGDFRHVFDETKAYWSGLGTFLADPSRTRQEVGRIGHVQSGTLFPIAGK